MADNLQIIFLLMLAMMKLDASFIQRAPKYGLRQTQGRSQAKLPISQMPKAMVMSLKTMSSTQDLLKKMGIYDQEKQKGVLPSQMKLKSRSSLGGANPGFTDLDLQLCIVRPYIHFLTQPDPKENAIIWPFAVKVPRCIGSCSVHPDIVQCVGKTVFNISLPAYRIPYGNSRKRRDAIDELIKLKDPVQQLKKRNAYANVQFIRVPVEAHTNCDCSCTVTKQMCNSRNKILNTNSCNCECKTVAKCQQPFQWNEDRCQCACGQDESTSRARCQRQTRLNGYWNHNKCLCICHRKSCREPRYNKVNPRTCGCECSVKICPNGQKPKYPTWNGKNCRC